MSMGALNIDFARPRPRHPRLGWLVLALGLTGLVLAGLEHQAVRTEHAQAEVALAQARAAVRPRAAPNRPSAPVPGQQAGERARAALVRPWDAVWRGLETATPDGVALLGIDASAAQMDTRLLAEARAMDDAIAYVEALRALPRVRAAQLTQHERRDADGLPLLRFSIEVRWEAVAP